MHELAVFFTYYIFEAFTQTFLGLTMFNKPIKKDRTLSCGVLIAISLVLTRGLLPLPWRILVHFAIMGLIFAKAAELTVLESLITVCTNIMLVPIGEAISLLMLSAFGIINSNAIVIHTVGGWFSLIPLFAAIAIILLNRRYQIVKSLRHITSSFINDWRNLRYLAVAVLVIQAIAVGVIRASRVTQTSGSLVLTKPIILDTLKDLIFIFPGVVATWLCWRAVSIAQAEYRVRLEAEMKLRQDLQASLDALQAAQIKLSEASRYKALGEIAGGMAHSFNNVLAAIKGRAQLIQYKNPSDEHLSSEMNKIVANVEEAVEAIRKIRDISAWSSDESFTVFNFDEIVISAIESSRFRRPSVEITSEIEPEIYIKGDSIRLKDAVVNLINNACDATDNQGHVQVVLRQSGGKVVLSVEDNGTGIPEEKLTDIFKPFYSTKSASGMGLGLSIVKSVVLRHNGDIKVESCLGKGSRFTLTLEPAANVDTVDIIKPNPAITNMKTRLVIADDNADAAQTLADFLTSIGCRVYLATDHQSRQDLLSRIPDVDALITDLSMPGVDGLELCQAFSNADIPVIVLTGWTGQLNEKVIKDAGIKAVIPKPFDIHEVAQHLLKIVGA